MIRLLVGLGNPGPEYEATRHNAGFWFVDEAARKLGVDAAARTRPTPAWRRASTGRTGPLWLLEPMTFMNLSGKSVAALARFFKIAPEEILVAHDELDLLPGQAKMKLGGSAAGHNGLKDIEAQLGSAGFWRLRLGIGHPGVKAEVVNYVLRKPPAEQREAIDKSIEQSIAALDLVLAGDMERAMMKVHAKPPRPEAGRRRRKRLVASPDHAGGVVMKRIAAAVIARRRSRPALAGVAGDGADRLPLRQHLRPGAVPAKARRSRPTTRAPPRSGPRRSGWPPTSDAAATRWSASRLRREAAIRPALASALSLAPAPAATAAPTKKAAPKKPPGQGAERASARASSRAPRPRPKKN